MIPRACGQWIWIAVIALVSTVGTASAAEWSRFRGPNGTGVSDDKNIPVRFGGAENLLWKVEIPGKGNSSPIVSKQRIFLQSASDDGGERAILCLALKDGKPLWKDTAPGTTATTHQKNTLASCTAAADGTRVYMPFWDGTNLSIAAYDYDGQRQWQKDLGPFVSQHGAGLSPVVVEGKVIVADDQDGESDVIALDAENGDIVWKKSRPAFRASYSTPLLVQRNGRSQELLVVSTAGVSTYDINDGSEKWKWTWSGNDKELRTVGSPIVSQGIVFFSGGNGPGDRLAAAVRLEGKGDVSATAPVWEGRKPFPYVPSAVVYGNHIYFVNDDGVAACVTTKTGEQVWNKRLNIGKVTASLLLIDGKVYVVSETGGIAVFAADPAGLKLLAECSLMSGSSTGATAGGGEPESERVLSTPAVADGRLLIRGEHHLYCFGRK